MAQLSGAALATALFLSCAGVLALSAVDPSTDRSSKTSAVNYRDLVSGLVIFGDSSVDVGVNNYLPDTLVRCDHVPYGRIFPGGVPTGRFCDGKLAVDFFAETLGYPFPLPYLAPNAHGPAILTGVNFASSGSGWNDNSAANIMVKDLGVQLGWYRNWTKEVVSLVGQEKGEFITRNSMHIISTGSNDWLNNYFFNLKLQQQYTEDTYITFLINQSRLYIQELYDAGAINIAVLGLPAFGCVPSQITLYGKGSSSCVESLNAIARNFNEQLNSLIKNELRPKFHGARLAYVDAYSKFVEIFNNPSAYGIRNVRDGCCGTGLIEKAQACNKYSIGTCEDATKFLWWDIFHPTQYANTFLSADLIDQITPTLLGPPQP